MVPTLGVGAVVMALQLCDQVSLAGFGYDLQHPQARLHYYEAIRMDAMKAQVSESTVTPIVQWESIYGSFSTSTSRWYMTSVLRSSFWETWWLQEQWLTSQELWELAEQKVTILWQRRELWPSGLWDQFQTKKRKDDHLMLSLQKRMENKRTEQFKDYAFKSQHTCYLTVLWRFSFLQDSFHHWRFKIRHHVLRFSNPHLTIRYCIWTSRIMNCYKNRHQNITK